MKVRESMGFSIVRLLPVLLLSRLATAQLTQTVSVGTFYNPPLIAAPGVNDTIVFLFMAGIHGVTQSSLEQPCAQLDGGFNSGLIKGDPDNPPSWNLTVTNVSEPIWYMCQALQPFSHCANGMVGAINAPVDQYANFTAAAKTLTSTPVPVTDMVLTGQGALATNPPITPVPTSVPATTTSSPTQSATQSSSSSSKSSSNLGAIVGGVVGGVAVICIFAGLLFFFVCRRSRKHDQLQKAEPFAIEASQKYFDGNEPESKNVSYLASQRAGPGSDGTGGATSGGGFHSPNPTYGNGFVGPTDQHLAYHEQMMRTVGGAGVSGAAAYGFRAHSEHASDTQEREATMAQPMPSPGPSDPRYSAYSEPRTLSSGNINTTQQQPQQQQRPIHDVREIAKEVADLLLPQLRANASSSPPPQSGTASGPQQVVNEANVTHESVAASERPHYTSSVFSTPEADRMKSPAPPEYS